MPQPIDADAFEEFSAAFREGVARLRVTRKDLGYDIRVSPRTLSRWSMGDLLPHPNQHARLLATFARAGDDVVAQMRRALGLPPLPAPAPIAPPAPEPPPPPRDVAGLRKEVELALLAAAERLDRSPKATRAAFVGWLEAIEGLGVSMEEARGWLGETRATSDAPRKRAKTTAAERARS